ncbi:MAG: hypothetical protein C0622_06455 [Desulfuromonas sp.]|nr:MAG: hypothetical protein C0622_06455 [Desulfuromonas sp.]
MRGGADDELTNAIRISITDGICRLTSYINVHKVKMKTYQHYIFLFFLIFYPSHVNAYDFIGIDAFDFFATLQILHVAIGIIIGIKYDVFKGIITPLLFPVLIFLTLISVQILGEASVVLFFLAAIWPVIFLFYLYKASNAKTKSSVSPPNSDNGATGFHS